MFSHESDSCGRTHIQKDLPCMGTAHVRDRDRLPGGSLANKGQARTIRG